VVLIAVTAVTSPRARVASTDPEALAEHLEGRVAALVAAGADETEVRRLVRDAVDLGRSRPR
jgi:hypothetical protein